MINWSLYDEKLVKTIKFYMPEIESQGEEAVAALVDDVMQSMEKYNFSLYNEYFKYAFYGMSEEQRSTFCGYIKYTECCKNSMRDMKISPFKNKLYTYGILKDFYKRDIIEVDGFNDFEKFSAFASKHNEFIVKEKDGSLGKNISKIVITNETPIKSAFFRVLQYGGCICEEWLNQCDEFSLFNSSCVNTVRIATMYDEGKLEPIYGMFRTGRNGQVVDNASMGGIACAIDVNTGSIISDGYTKQLEHFVFHPESQIQFKGYKIPRWNEVLPIIEEMHKHCPEAKIVGWDMTLTDKGWVLIEGNSKPNIDTIQLIYGKTFGHGLNDVIMSTIGRYCS